MFRRSRDTCVARFEDRRTVIVLLTENNIRALVGLTLAAYRQNDTAQAEKYFSRALATGKIAVGDYSQLGMTLLIAGKDREAVVYYRKALDLRPNGFDYYNLACAYAKYGDKEPALQSLEQSFSFGYPSREQVDDDPDLNSIRKEEKCKALVAKLPH